MIEVCAAIICINEKYLITTRPPGKHLSGKWEFPGGKLKPGESHCECIKRELYEELGVKVIPLNEIYTIKWHYPEKTVLLHFYETRPENKNNFFPFPHDEQIIKFATAKELLKYDFAEADLSLINFLKQNKYPQGD